MKKSDTQVNECSLVLLEDLKKKNQEKQLSISRKNQNLKMLNQFYPKIYPMEVNFSSIG
jgi:hypothetical protein